MRRERLLNMIHHKTSCRKKIPCFTPWRKMRVWFEGLELVSGICEKGLMSLKFICAPPPPLTMSVPRGDARERWSKRLAPLRELGAGRRLHTAAWRVGLPSALQALSVASPVSTTVQVQVGVTRSDEDLLLYFEISCVCLVWKFCKRHFLKSIG
ncbi:hypothetical protein FOCC_FOCC005010 [Frankliniella occidentalis]|nr:hypothetical protein FOCC_FOCC005010 [Frankliniella occidentalis]